jgi:hypothetical protein
MLEKLMTNNRKFLESIPCKYLVLSKEDGHGMIINNLEKLNKSLFNCNAKASFKCLKNINLHGHFVNQFPKMMFLIMKPSLKIPLI